MRYLKLFEQFEQFEYIDFTETESYKDGDYHQAIMDIGYNEWQRKKGNIESSIDMFEYVRSNFGDEFVMMIQIGNYNRQVTNGGHNQYWDNGYASENTNGFMSNHTDCINLSNMIKSIKKSLLYTKYEITKKVVSIMEECEDLLKDFEDRCDDCEGQGYIDEKCDECNGDGGVTANCDDCGGSGEDDEGGLCDNCDGSGEMEEPCYKCNGDGNMSDECNACGGSGGGYLGVDILDTPYYALSDEFMEDCNDYSKRLIDSYIDTQKLFKNINK